MPRLLACVAFAIGALAKARLPKMPADMTTPVQQRIALNGPNSITVSWNTYMKPKQACVKYGPADCSLTQQACSPSSAQTYPTSRTWFNSVTLTNLTPGTKYCYQVVSSNSTTATFRSPRLAGDQTPFTINAVIDLGVYGEDGYTIEMDHAKRDLIPSIPPSMEHTTISRLAKTIDDYDFVIHPGDLGYADDWILHDHNLFEGRKAYQAITEQFYDQLAPIASRKPYMASPGNHEATCQQIPGASFLCPAGQKNFTDFMTRFGSSMPSTFPSASQDARATANADKARKLARPPFWYSFEYGMAHVVMINTETDFDRAPDGVDGATKLRMGPFGAPNQQLQFLEADLASVDRTVTPWVIVSGHRPWYSAGTETCKPCQDAFERLMYKYGVDLGVFGHVHNSQRFMPVYNGVADPAGMRNPKAPMYIVAGGAGSIEGLAAFAPVKPPFTAFAYNDNFAYASISFLDRNNLRVVFRRSSTGEVVDSSTLYKAHDKQFVVQ
ncbi:uncharacterized protein UV8b_04725 [Ustilaginoidea virens]|uniref:Purple acid phosphatase n=1 Tax=Ustilaginoidea virens TaxID=1159556 RepID=A0A8E5HRZ6_USTVR|nr:uncharacterized protein UV8b_04725 [Ustilaginoidea virens]QUC20484.1 hypothetical protein UV8b_04725 [Ustilaginoidea virens]